MGILNLKKILLKVTIGSIMFNDVMTKLDASRMPRFGFKHVLPI